MGRSRGQRHADGLKALRQHRENFVTRHDFQAIQVRGCCGIALAPRAGSRQVQSRPVNRMKTALALLVRRRASML